MQQPSILLYALAAPFLGLAIHHTIDKDDTATDTRTEELGRVNWGRNLEAGLITATDADKPVLLLFQEIPG